MGRKVWTRQRYRYRIGGNSLSGRKWPGADTLFQRPQTSPRMIKRTMERGQEQRRLAVLSYHKIGAPSSGVCESCFYVPVEVFAAQMQVVESLGWTFIDVETLLLGLDEPALLPERSALITFDDGYLSCLTLAAPVMEKFGCPGIIFVPTAFIGGTNRFDDGVEPEEKICRWEELLELERRGVSVQSHGISHRKFSNLSSEEIMTELKDSARVLESGLRRRVSLFSFPHGDMGQHPSTTIDLLRETGYRAAFVSNGGVVNTAPWTEPYTLRRIVVVTGTDLARLRK
jgi:peptidoglycan/xylan/chitin deacetylase (PgdA/CDA1 family)